MSDTILTVRHTEPSDFTALHRIFVHPKAIRGTAQLPFPSAESWRKRLAEPPPGFYSLVVCAGDEVVGQLGLHTAFNSPRRRHAGSIGMAVRDDWHGRGAGSALMQAVVVMADKWLNLIRLELEVYTDNTPAIRLYEKFGFVKEGVHKQYAFQDGVFVDAYAMARLRTEDTELRRSGSTVE